MLHEFKPTGGLAGELSLLQWINRFRGLQVTEYRIPAMYGLDSLWSMEIGTDKRAIRACFAIKPLRWWSLQPRRHIGMPQRYSEPDMTKTGRCDGSESKCPANPSKRHHIPRQ